LLRVFPIPLTYVAIKMQYAKYKGHILNSDADTRNLEGKGIVQILSP